MTRIATLAIAATISCGGDAAGPSDEFAGSWTLVLHDHAAPPDTFSVPFSRDTTIYYAGLLDLHSGGRFDLALQWLSQEDFVVRPAVLGSTAGTWTADGTVLALHHDAGDSIEGRMRGDSLDLDIQAHTLTFVQR